MKKLAPGKRPIRKTLKYDQELGRVLYKAREARNLTQEEFAAFCGIRKYDMWLLEKGGHATPIYDQKWAKVAAGVPEVAEYLTTHVRLTPVAPMACGNAPEPPKVSETAFDEIFAQGYQAGRKAEAKTRKQGLLTKADLAVSTARNIVKGAPDESVENIAVELMSLTDHDLVALYGRLTTPDEG